MTAPARLLVADDDRDVLEALRLLLRGEEYEVDTAVSPGALIAGVTTQDFDAVLMDMNYTRDTTGGVEGLDLLTRLQALDATLPVIVMTAWGSIEGAVEALRRGARDYIEKPWNNARLLHVLATQVELSRAIRTSQRLESENRALRPDGAPELIAQSAAMQPVLRLMERIGPSDAGALITGEHGTGKEVVAAWLHAASPRRVRAMVTVNLGGLSEGVFESEMFGHVKGSFTDAKADRMGRFELADGGTLFLDEIANLSLAQQAKLLRVLQTGRSSASARPRRAAWTCAFSPPRTPTSAPRWRRAGSARICSSDSIRWSFTFRRCASAGTTSRSSRRISCANSRPITGVRYRRSVPRPCRRCSATAGRATCGNWRTPWSGPRCSLSTMRCGRATSRCRRSAPRPPLSKR